MMKPTTSEDEKEQKRLARKEGYIPISSEDRMRLVEMIETIKYRFHLYDRSGEELNIIPEYIKEAYQIGFRAGVEEKVSEET